MHLNIRMRFIIIIIIIIIIIKRNNQISFVQ